MAPKPITFSSMKNNVKKCFTWNFAKNLLLDPSNVAVIAIPLLLAEIFINVSIIQRVPYTEIDWKAYMQECEGFLNGTLDYSQLKGDTGPLVYPAGFVYIYSVLYFLTSYGENIRLAQYVFVIIYILQLVFVLRIYIKTRKVPPYVLLFTILTSYRIHSIYVLRLFNDPVAVLLFYISLNLFLDSKWNLGSLFYSLAVSVKMNILLFAPALFFFYLINLGLTSTIKQLLICALVQLVLGLPFLLHSPVSYVKGSFDVGRVFNHTWTVNYRFLDIPTFESKCFHLFLLTLHLALLVLFYPTMSSFFKSYCRLRTVQKQVQPQIDAQNLSNKKKKSKPAKEELTKEQEDFLKSFEKGLQKSSGSKKVPQKAEEEEDTFFSINFDSLSQLVILPMFLANFIGVMCARSLHYQFYSWYFHSLPYLLWSTNFPIITRFLILALIEMCWNTYPSTIFSSLMLHGCHIAVLYGIYKKLSHDWNLAAKARQ